MTRLREYRRLPALGPVGTTRPLAHSLLRGGSNGVVFRSVRYPGNDCIACFRPKLVLNVRPDAYFEFRWEGTLTPSVAPLSSPP